MYKKVSRRKVLTTGAAAGFCLHTACTRETAHEQTEDKGPGRQLYWAPGKDMNLPRDLIPGSTPIRLGAFLQTKDITNFRKRASSLMESYRKQGFTALVVTGESLKTMNDSDLREFNDALKQYDVVISAVTGNRYTNFIHPDSSFRQQYLKNLAHFIELADAVNCPAVPTICGTCAPKTPDDVTFQDLFTKEYRYNVHPDNWSLKTWKLLVKSIRQVLNDTAGMKAAIAMEAQVTTTIDGPLAHRNLIDDVGDPRLGVELDPVNMITLQNYYYTTELLNECFDLLGEHILTCHAKDTTIWPNRQTVHVHEVCPGRGVLDYKTYLVRMSQLDWPRMLLPEHIPAEQYPEAYAFLRKMVAETGVELYG